MRRFELAIGRDGERSEEGIFLLAQGFCDVGKVFAFRSGVVADGTDALEEGSELSGQLVVVLDSLSHSKTSFETGNKSRWRYGKVRRYHHIRMGILWHNRGGLASVSKKKPRTLLVRGYPS